MFKNDPTKLSDPSLYKIKSKLQESPDTRAILRIFGRNTYTNVSPKNKVVNSYFFDDNHIVSPDNRVVNSIISPKDTDGIETESKRAHATT
jgi:hypothetical protein